MSSSCKIWLATSPPQLRFEAACSPRFRWSKTLAIGFEFEVLDSSELALRLKVKESWVVEQSKCSRSSDPIPVFRLGKHRRYRWGSPELSDWLDRRAGHTTIRKAGSK